MFKNGEPKRTLNKNIIHMSYGRVYVIICVYHGVYNNNEEM